MKIDDKNRLRTWIEVDKKSIYHNIAEFRKIIKPDVKLMAVIKSNAYGHSLIDFAETAEDKVDWFGVDSITEGLKLRQKGLKRPILVLGYTLPSRIKEAAENNISLTVSTLDTLKHLTVLKNLPKIHIKIDTGMYRQGFFIKDLSMVIKLLKRFKLYPEGLYTHLAAAKDKLYPDYSFKQIEIFKKADKLFKKVGYNHYFRHVAASAGTILYPESHFNMVRIGIGLYGMFSSKELKTQFNSHGQRSGQGSDPCDRDRIPVSINIKLKPVLTWKSIIGEIKTVPKDSFIGYDLTEKVPKLSKLAIIPVGYWHGFDRGFSNCGEVLIRGKRCKILGRVNMDMIVIDVSNVSGIEINDEVVLIGRQGKEKITVEDIALKINTNNYEIITRINPLIKRFYI